MFDLILYPLSLDAGRELNALPGLLAVAAPKRSARMRAQDWLIIHCQLRTMAGGSAGFTPAQQHDILQSLADTYFKTPGSVTAGLKLVITQLNDFLLGRNLRRPQEGQVIAVANMAVLHGNVAYIAHGGATHSYLAGKTQVHHFDDGRSTRGLGLSRVATPHFYQSAFEPGDVLVFCAAPPAAWSQKALAGACSLSMEHLRRRLLSDAGINLEAVVMRAQPGKGALTYWKSAEGPRRTGSEARAAGQTTGTASADPKVASSPLQQAPMVENARKPEPVDAPTVEQADRGAAESDGIEPLEVQVESPAPAETSDILPTAMEEDVAANATLAADALAPETGTSQPAGQENPIGQDRPIGRGPVFLGAPPATAGTGAGEQFVRRPGRDMARAQRPENLAADHSANTIAMAEAGKPGTVSTAENMPGVEGARPAFRRPFTRSSMAVARVGEAQPASAAQQSTARAPDRNATRSRGQPAVMPARGEAGKQLRRSLNAAWQQTRPARSKVSRALTWVSRHAIPRRYDEAGREIPWINVSPAWMLAIAIIVPMMVVSAGMAVYVASGRPEQQQIRFAEAQAYAQQASQITDPAQQRDAWMRVLEMVSRAEEYGVTDESNALRLQAQQTLDGLEGFTRLVYNPAVKGGLGEGVTITRMIATLNDVFLLDSSQGRILHVYRTAYGYELNQRFVCGPGQVGTVTVGPMIDLAEIPVNNELHASVIGIDANGNLLYCSSTATNLESRALVVPDVGWGSINGLTSYGDRLYVLDPPGNAVYYYDGINGVFEDSPHLYFGSSIPLMANVIDLAVDQEFLYLLHDDGQMTICTGGGFVYAEPDCTEPAPYSDPRPGYEPNPLVFPGTRFTQIVTTQPPDPSLFALDGLNQAVYHLSLRRLNLQRQYRAAAETDFPLPNRAPSAFAIAPNRRVLLAFENQLFYAPLP